MIADHNLDSSSPEQKTAPDEIESQIVGPENPPIIPFEEIMTSLRREFSIPERTFDRLANPSCYERLLHAYAANHLLFKSLALGSILYLLEY